ncbi:MAG: transglycosylase SLT domain-containing protein [Bacteroidia bacterium]|nr:transglycosylase SLT domain-containing protein [Bacteroidia bacterium]
MRKDKQMLSFKKLFQYPLVAVVVGGWFSCNNVQKAEAQKSNLPQIPEEVIIRKVVVTGEDTLCMEFVNSNPVFREGWDSLAQPQFWKQIMCLSPDSCIINVARTRLPLQTSCFRTWCSQSEYEKTALKGRLKDEYCVDYGEELYVTNGKREFYEHRKSIPTISKAVSYFRTYGVDPWYAQTILLIESPGKHLSKSYVGAAGPFQLMRSVAVKYGLKVNKYTDERTDLKRAAYGAAKLISGICIPKVKEMLDARGIPYQETDTWFRLLVLHAYHAGAGNLACAINKINPVSGGPELIRTLWKTECGGFKNESQNYSQIALAAIMNFEDIIRLDGDSIFMVQGDRAYATLSRSGEKQLNQREEALFYALLMYERDLADGTISYAYFEERVNSIRKEINRETTDKTMAGSVTYPLNEDQLLRLSNELIRKRKMDDAIQLLRFNLELFPQSPATAEQLSKAYRIKGNAGLAQKYMTKSNELVNTPK